MPSQVLPDRRPSSEAAASADTRESSKESPKPVTVSTACQENLTPGGQDDKPVPSSDACPTTSTADVSGADPPGDPNVDQ